MQRIIRIDMSETNARSLKSISMKFNTQYIIELYWLLLARPLSCIMKTAFICSRRLRAIKFILLFTFSDHIRRACVDLCFNSIQNHFAACIKLLRQSLCFLLSLLWLWLFIIICVLCWWWWFWVYLFIYFEYVCRRFFLCRRFSLTRLRV